MNNICLTDYYILQLCVLCLMKRAIYSPNQLFVMKTNQMLENEQINAHHTHIHTRTHPVYSMYTAESKVNVTC